MRRALRPADAQTSAMRTTDAAKLDSREEVYFLMYYAGFSLMEALSLTDEQRAWMVKSIREKVK